MVDEDAVQVLLELQGVQTVKLWSVKLQLRGYPHVAQILGYFLNLDLDLEQDQAFAQKNFVPDASLQPNRRVVEQPSACRSYSGQQT